MNIRYNFFKHCKELKKMVKRKKYLYTKSIFDQLKNWKETDSKLYWQFLNSIRKDSNKKSSNINKLPKDGLAQHFQSQGKPEYYNYNINKHVNDKSKIIEIFSRIMSSLINLLLSVK